MAGDNSEDKLAMEGMYGVDGMRHVGWQIPRLWDSVYNVGFRTWDGDRIPRLCDSVCK